MLLTKDLLLMVDDSETAFVEMPEYQKPGEEMPTVRVRSLMSDQRQRLFDRSRDIRDKGATIPGGINALCCAMGLIDEKGVLLFPVENEGAVQIGRKHPEIVARIANKIYELSDMTRSQREANEKKSLTTTTSDSGTSSPET